MSEYEPGQDPFSIDGSTENVTPEDAQKGGGGASVSKVGFYHVSVESVSFKQQAEEKPHVLVVMDILAGEHEDQIHKKLYHRIYPQKLENAEHEQRRINGLASFFFQFGVMTEEEAFGNNQFLVNKGHFERLEGCQGVIKVTKRDAREYVDKKTGEKKQGKESFDIWTNDVWNIHHEKVADVPKDWALAQLAPAADSQAQLAADLDGI